VSPRDRRRPSGEAAAGPQPGSPEAGGAWRDVPGGALLAVRLQPRASRNQLLGEQAGALRISLTTPPVEGRANRALLLFLGKLLRIPPSTLELRQGAHSRDKLLFVPGLTATEARLRLDATH